MTSDSNDHAAAPVPVTVITGFLGAGKTTLVNAWLEQIPRGEVAVIVNELGDVGIDGALLAARVRTLVEIAGGCVCCATQADLVRALGDVASASPRPRRILVETSGAASPAGVLRAISAGGPRETHRLDGVITVVDATRVDSLRSHDLALEQLGYADVVVLSRVEACDEDARRRAEDSFVPSTARRWWPAPRGDAWPRRRSRRWTTSSTRGAATSS